ncbi:cbb3-type cytochrome oxidase assembly protein CcoS [Bradyrhizobium sp. Gha]|uniref:cbb3-type cytochrome oxidase assembly protein CcoS n=1 Tax=Bradyrhizobium sp. Gha TaxID=1855318 RepID=UPI0008E02059|nr:cbb3-type cytochrome oxidase assembly protein CcoS [Bradyrhizobium sp. Gha]SFK13751.1 cytochrome oxidase maturation protein, cbb3-type [Bradyrhizobium sp. Gha]
MEILVFLVPLALMLGGAGLAAFLWSLRSGQYDDLDGAAWRAIAEDDDEPPIAPAGGNRWRPSEGGEKWGPASI